jgi:hypothetical protein
MQIPSGSASVSYPPSFVTEASDPGTVTAAVHDQRGKFLAYLNVTPRQGDEKLKGFPAFRLGLLRKENRTVHQDAGAEGLPFSGARGSCVMDHYTTRIGSNPYLEFACFVMGARTGSVVVAAAASGSWRRFEGQLRQAVASFAVQ